MHNPKNILLIISSVSMATMLSAGEFQVLGSKALGMGGAGIANSPSSIAAFNNPALLGFNQDKFGIHIGAGIGAKDTGAGKSISDLNDLGFTNLSNVAAGNADNLTAGDISKLSSARNIVLGMNQKGFEANPTANVGISYGSFGSGIFLTSDIGAKANIDQSRTDLIFETSVPGTYIDILTNNVKTLGDYQSTSLHYATKNGTTNIEVSGLAVAEVPLAYGHAFNTGYGTFSLGGSAKLMAGKTFNKKVLLDEKNAFDNLDQNTKDSTTWGIDLGAAYKPSFDNDLTLALVGKNLNTPEFDVQSGPDYKLRPAIKAGAAYKLKDWVEFALDGDLTENKSLSGYKTQYIGGGINLDLSIIEFNAGIMQNIAAGDQAGPIYTAGIATGPKWLHLELSAQMASKTGQVDGNTYPKQASVGFAISSVW